MIRRYDEEDEAAFDNSSAYLPSRIDDLNRDRVVRQNYYGFGTAHDEKSIEVEDSVAMKHKIQLVTNDFEYIRDNFATYCNNIDINSSSNNINYNITNNSTKTDGDDGPSYNSNPDKIGQWQIGRLLGKGGFAKVYKCYDTKNNNIAMAIKIIANDKETKINCWLAENEIECLKQVSHKNVIKLLCFKLNVMDNQAVFVLEYAPHGELTQLLQKLGAFSEFIARTYFRQIINGLKACHDIGIVHRDVKPQNILLDSNYCIKLCDFGLGCLVTVKCCDFLRVVMFDSFDFNLFFGFEYISVENRILEKFLKKHFVPILKL